MLDVQMKISIFSLSVDDMLLVGNDKDNIVTSLSEFLSKFDMKDMGEVNYIFGLKVH